MAVPLTSAGQQLLDRCDRALSDSRRDGLSPAQLDAVGAALVWLSCEGGPRAALRSLMVRHGCRRAALHCLVRSWRLAGIIDGEQAMQHVRVACGLPACQEPPDRTLLRAALAYIDHLGLRGTIAADAAPEPATLDHQMYSPSPHLRSSADVALWAPATTKAAALLRVLPVLCFDTAPRDERGPIAIAHDALCWLALTPAYWDTTSDLLRHYQCEQRTWTALRQACTEAQLSTPAALVSSRPDGVAASE